MANRKSLNSPGQKAGEDPKPGRPKYRSGEPAYDKEIAETPRTSKESMDENGRDITPADHTPGSDFVDDSNETSGGRRPGKRKGTQGADNPSA